jgi:hypothetical protein
VVEHLGDRGVDLLSDRPALWAASNQVTVMLVNNTAAKSVLNDGVLRVDVWKRDGEIQ